MDELFGGFAAFGVLIIALPLALIILGLAIVFNGRREPDPTGVRTTAVYFSLVDFTALIVLVLAATSIMASLSSLIVDEEDRQTASSFDAVGPATDITEFETDPFSLDEDFEVESVDPDDKAIRDTIQGGLIVVPALLVFLFHWRRREAFVAEPRFEQSPGFRVDRIYLYAICFVTALLGSIALGRGVYDIFRLIIPGVTSDLGDNSLERKEALSDLLTMLVLGGISTYLFFWHWSLVSGETELWKRPRGVRSPSPPGGATAVPAAAGGTTPPPPTGPGPSAPPPPSVDG